MNDNDTPRHPYGEYAHLYRDEPCLLHTTVPTKLVEHLVDSDLDDLTIMRLLCTLPSAPIVVVADVHRCRAA